MRASVGVVSLVALSALSGCGIKKQKAGPEPVPVQAAVVAAQPVQPSWVYSGEIRPATEVQLAFKEPGYVAGLYQVRGAAGRMRDVQAGDEIPAGAVLARLRGSDYQATFNTAVGQQHAMQGALEASQAELDRAKADQLKADQDMNRAQALYAAGAMTRPDYDAAVAQHDAARAAVNAAMREIEARRGQLDAAAGQAATARVNLGDTTLEAPMAGVVVEKHVERGDLAAAGTTAFTLDDVRLVKVSFGVPDVMLGYLKLGAEVPVEIEAPEQRTLQGRITEIAAAANRESRVFNIEVTLPNRDRSLNVGMIARIRIERANAQAEPVIPMAALMSAESGSGGYSVFAIQEKDGMQFAQLKSVRIGETLGESVAIEEGLTPGERIIVTRTNQLNEGSPVRVVN